MPVENIRDASWPRRWSWIASLGAAPLLAIAALLWWPTPPSAQAATCSGAASCLAGGSVFAHATLNDDPRRRRTRYTNTLFPDNTTNPTTPHALPVVDNPLVFTNSQNTPLVAAPVAPYTVGSCNGTGSFTLHALFPLVNQAPGAHNFVTTPFPFAETAQVNSIARTLTGGFPGHGQPLLEGNNGGQPQNVVYVVNPCFGFFGGD